MGVSHRSAKVLQVTQRLHEPLPPPKRRNRPRLPGDRKRAPIWLVSVSLLQLGAIGVLSLTLYAMHALWQSQSAQLMTLREIARQLSTEPLEDGARQRLVDQLSEMAQPLPPMTPPVFVDAKATLVDAITRNPPAPPPAAPPPPSSPVSAPRSPTVASTVPTGDSATPAAPRATPAAPPNASAAASPAATAAATLEPADNADSPTPPRGFAAAPSAAADDPAMTLQPDGRDEPATGPPTRPASPRAVSVSATEEPRPDASADRDATWAAASPSDHGDALPAWILRPPEESATPIALVVRAHRPMTRELVLAYVSREITSRQRVRWVNPDKALFVLHVTVTPRPDAGDWLHAAPLRRTELDPAWASVSDRHADELDRGGADLSPMYAWRPFARAVETRQRASLQAACQELAAQFHEQVLTEPAASPADPTPSDAQASPQQVAGVDTERP